jgi:hypothetical protein
MLDNTPSEISELVFKKKCDSLLYGSEFDKYILGIMSNIKEGKNEVGYHLPSGCYLPSEEYLDIVKYRLNEARIKCVIVPTSWLSEEQIHQDIMSIVNKIKDLNPMGGYLKFHIHSREHLQALEEELNKLNILYTINVTPIEESIHCVPPGTKYISGFDVEIRLSGKSFTNHIPSGNNYVLYMMFATMALAFTPTLLK